MSDGLCGGSGAPISRGERVVCVCGREFYDVKRVPKHWVDDNPPLTEEQLKRFRPIPAKKRMRLRVGLSRKGAEDYDDE